MRFIVVMFLLFGFQFYSQAQKFSAFSPDGKKLLIIALGSDGRLTYSLRADGLYILQPSALGLQLKEPAIELQRFNLVGIDSSNFLQQWKPVWGEESEIEDHHKTILIHLKEKSGSGILLDVEFRLFNEGIGFRYVFPDQQKLQHFIVANENTHFNFAKNHKAFWIPGDYDTNEYLYNQSPLSEVNAYTAATKEKDIAVVSLFHETAVQTPLLLQTAEGYYISIHEAALLNYPAMQLIADTKKFDLVSALVPDAVGNKAYLQTPAKTPWRTILATKTAAELLNSRMILNLNEPAALVSTDWIKPQKFAGVWWEMHTGKATWQFKGGKHGANTENVRKYIDFAASHHLDGVLVEGWNAGWEDWFGHWKEEVFDFVTPYPDYNIKELSAYAASKGVKLIMHHETSGSVTNYDRRMDTAFRFMRQFGIETVKTGYVGRIIPRGEHHDGQWMVNHYQRVVDKAAGYKIMVDAHEPVRPTGLHRTYPNWMASEAARGQEFNNAPTLGITPEHTTILPFTRLLGGPMDFTPGLFRFRLNQFDSARHQKVNTTLAKQMALYITMYSPLQMVADLPENYAKYPEAFQFVVDVPVDWSATKIIAAVPGDLVCIARKDKHSENWYIGGISDEASRTVELDLSFLKTGANYEARIYKDGEDASFDLHPESITIETKEWNQTSRPMIRMARGGGFAIQLKRK